MVSFYGLENIEGAFFILFFHHEEPDSFGQDECAYANMLLHLP